MHAGLRKKARSRAAKRRRRLQLPNREVSLQRQQLDEVIDADERQNKTEKTSLQNEIHVEGTMDGYNQKESYKLRAPMMNQSEDTGVQATKSNLDADNLVCLIGINCSGDADAKVDLLNETQVASEEAGNVPPNVEIAALSAVKVQEK